MNEQKETRQARRARERSLVKQLGDKALEAKLKSIVSSENRTSLLFTVVGVSLGLLSWAYASLNPDPSAIVAHLLLSLCLASILKGFWDFFALSKRTKLGVLVVFGSIFVVGQYFAVGYLTRPSFVFVVPGVWLNGDTWDFIVNHRGPKTNYTVEVLFVDEDRKKRVVAARSTLSSADIESYEKIFRYPEISPQGHGSIFATQFQWRPLNPEHEHYGLVADLFSVTQPTGRLATGSDR